jgi:hypothetical protein
VLQVRVDDLVDVAGVDVGVPDALRVDHGDGPARTSVQASGLVDADLARAGKAFLLHPRLAVVEALVGAVVGARLLALVAVVEAEEDVSLVVGNRCHA